jgi:uncharacterized membrane protein
MQTFLLTVLVAIPAMFGYLVAAAMLYDEYSLRVKSFLVKGRTKPSKSEAIYIMKNTPNKKSKVPWL